MPWPTIRLRARRCLAIAAVVSFFSAPIARAERAEIHEHSVSAGIGYGRFATRDDAASDLVYGTHAGAAALEYAGEAGAFHWGLRTNLAYGVDEAIGVGTRTIRFASTNPDGSLDIVDVPVRGRRLAASADARLGYVHRLDRLDLFAGATVEFAIARPEGFIASGRMQRVGIGPHLGLRLRLDDRQALAIEARTSLVGWATRMAYHQSVSIPGGTAYQGFVETGSAARSLGNQRTFDLVGSYRVRVREHLAVRATAHLSYLRDEDPRILRGLGARFFLFLDTVI